jgi:hypothetical protein
MPRKQRIKKPFVMPFTVDQEWVKREALTLSFLPYNQKPIIRFMYLGAFGTIILGSLLWLFVPEAAVAQQANSDDIILVSLDQAQSVQQSFAKLWEEYMQGPAYKVISNTSGGIAALCAVLWLTMNYKNLSESFDEAAPLAFRFVIGPVVAAIFLTHTIG